MEEFASQVGGGGVRSAKLGGGGGTQRNFPLIKVAKKSGYKGGRAGELERDKRPWVKSCSKIIGGGTYRRG